MEYNDVFSISRSAMLGRKHGSDSSRNKEVERMLWNSPPVGSLQSSVPVASNGLQPRQHGAGVDDTRRERTLGVRYRVHRDEDDGVSGSPVELCDAAVLKITDATTKSVGATPSVVLTEVTADSSAATPPPTPPASVDVTGEEAERRRRWLDLCHCERHLLAIKVYYFTFIAALGVVIAYAVVFLKQIGLSPFQIGVISGIRPVLGFISAPAWGAVADRYNIRRILMLVSMCAWLVFFSALYFVEAPTRRGYCPDSVSADHEDVMQTAAATVASSANATAATVDVGLQETGQNSSTAATTYVQLQELLLY